MPNAPEPSPAPAIASANSLATAHDVSIRTLIPMASGQVVRTVGQLASLKAATSLLTPDTWGLVSELQSSANFFLAALITPVWLYCIRAFFPWRDQGKLKPSLGRFVWFCLGIAALGGAVCALAQGIWHPFPNADAVVLGLVVAAWIAGMGLSQLAATGLNLLGYRLAYAIVTSLPVWLGLGCAILLTHQRRDFLLWSAGLAVGWMLASLTILIFWVRIPASPSPPTLGETMPFTWRAAWDFSWPQLATALIWWVHTDGNRFLIAWLSGPQTVGFFVAAYQLGFYPVRMAELVIEPLCEPRFFHQLRTGEPASICRAWRQYAAVHVPAMLLAGIFAATTGPYLARILLGPQYQLVGAMAAFPAAAETVRGINYVWYLLGSALVKLQLLIVPVAAGATVVVTGVTSLSHWDPLRGPLLAMALATLAVLMTAQWVFRRQIQFSWPREAIVRALWLSLPMLALLPWWDSYHDHRPSLGVSLATLAVAGIYLCLAEIWVVHRATD